MKLNEIINFIEKSYPRDLAYDWDNVGLIIGDRGSDIGRILLTLDVTDEVVDEAIRLKADLIISHHPFIFSGMKSITDEGIKGPQIMRLIKNDIAVYSMHTNFDVAHNGLNDGFMRRIGIEDYEVLCEASQATLDGQEVEVGMGRIGDLSEPMSILDLCELIKSALDIEYLRVTGDPRKQVKRVGVVTGSGGEFAAEAFKRGADVFITGDMKYHPASDAMQEDIDIIDAGHFGTEDIFRDLMYDYLKELDVEVIRSSINVDPFILV